MIESKRKRLSIASLLMALLIMFNTALPTGVAYAAETSADLKNFVTDVVFDGIVQDGDGNYIVNTNTEYGIALTFAETEDWQFDNDAELEYPIPQGLIVADLTKNFDIAITDTEGTATLAGNTFRVESNKIYVKFNSTDAAVFDRLKAAANVKFKLEIKGKIDQTATELVFSDTITKKFKFETPKGLEIEKTAVHDKDNREVDYTVTVRSLGANTNVVIIDDNVGTALTLDTDKGITVTSDKRTLQPADYSIEYAVDKFAVTGLSLVDQEVLTITYSAKVDYNALKGTGSEDETKNIATVKSDENPEPKKAEHIAKVDMFGIEKKSGRPQKVSEGSTKYYVTWTATINEDYLMKTGGVPIEDYISRGDNIVEFTSYEGISGIRVEVTKQDGSTETRDIPWTDSSIKLKYRGNNPSNPIIGWTYTPPEADGNASYKIFSRTIVDTAGILGDTHMNNLLRVGKRVTTPNLVISNTGQGPKPTKEAVSYNSQEIVWKITIPIRPEGYDDRVRLIDDMPYVIVDQIKKEYHIDTFVDLTIEGLLEGESYTINNRNKPGEQYHGPDIEFFRNTGKTIKGLLPNPTGRYRNIVVTIHTKVNQEWLDKAHEAGYATTTGAIDPVHKNSASFRIGETGQVGMTARVTPKKQGMEKIYTGREKATIEGVSYPVFKYKVEISVPQDGEPIKDGEIIADAFDTTYLKYYSGTAKVGGKHSASDPLNDTGGVVDVTDTADGMSMKLTTLPKDGSGKAYSIYVVEYSLIVKDKDALERLNRAATGQDVSLENTAKWNGLESKKVATYRYEPIVDKTLTDKPSSSNGYIATFRIALNEEGQDLIPNTDTYVAKDVLSKNLRLLPNTIRVVEGGYVLDYDYAQGTNTVEFRGIPDKQSVVIEYQAEVLGKGENVPFSNTVTVGSYEKKIEETVSFSASGGGSASNPSITIVKTDKDKDENNDIKYLEGVEFQLFYKRVGVSDATPVTDKNGKEVKFTTGTDGKVLIIGDQAALGWALWADGRTYLLKETKTPTGYKPLAEPIEFVLAENPSNTTEYKITGAEINITNERPKTSITVTKVWNGVTGTKPTVSFELYRKIDGGNFEKVPVSEAPIKVLSDGNTQAAWANLYANDLNGKPYQFEVREVGATNGSITLDGSTYSVAVTKNTADAFTVTNTKSPSTPPATPPSGGGGGGGTTPKPPTPSTEIPPGTVPLDPGGSGGTGGGGASDESIGDNSTPRAGIDGKQRIAGAPKTGLERDSLLGDAIFTATTYTAGLLLMALFVQSEGIRRRRG